MKKLVVLVLVLAVALVLDVYGKTPKSNENNASGRTNTEDKEACEAPVLGRPEDLLAEQTFALRFQGAVVDGFRLFHFAVRPLSDHVR